MNIWQPCSQFEWHDFPPSYQEWLCYPGSLTERLRALSQNNLRSELQLAGWQNLDPDEITPLARKDLSPHWVREITFRSGNNYWEWARTIIPPSSLVEEGKAFLDLGERPIGEILFKDPQLKRTEFEIAHLPKQHPYSIQAHSFLNQKHDLLWARRSLLYYYQNPLLIYELFLPSLLEAIEQSS